jgi:hypothetical protein
LERSQVAVVVVMPSEVSSVLPARLPSLQQAMQQAPSSKVLPCMMR